MILRNKLIGSGFRGGGGGSGGSIKPPFETNSLHFHGKFQKKSGKSNKYSGKINKSKRPLEI